MGWAPVATGTHRDPAGIGFRVGDELRNGLGREGWIYLHDLGDADNARDWRNVANKIVVKSFIECGVDCGGAADRKERVTVSGCSDNRLNANVTAAAWTILNDELLPKTLGQPLADQTCGDVVHAAGRKWDD